MAEQSEKTIVNAQITVSKKERWEEAIDTDGKYNSISHLIRRSVENELAGEHDDDRARTDAAQADDINVNLDMDELASMLDTRFDELSDQLARIQASVKSSQKPESSLTNQILDLIPKLPDTNAAYTWMDTRMGDDGFLKNEHPGADDEGRALASATRIANHLDVEESEVWQAIYAIEGSSDRYFGPREHGELWLFELTG